MKYFLGIDTSCYTTSAAILDENGNLISDARKLLTVKPGKRGLAQSEMVFQHTRNLPVLMEEILCQLGSPVHFSAIGVSGYPRPLPDSYMPAFLVGDGCAKVLAAAGGSLLCRISHQEAHIFAGIWSAGGPYSEQFLALHVSGGTTEIVKVSNTAECLSIALLGGSTDLHAGQFVDRIGVALGLPFPAGPHLERLAQQGRKDSVSIPSAVGGMKVSFSGPETHALRMHAQGYSPEIIAAGVEQCIATSLWALIKNAAQTTALSEVLLVGGVSSNQFIRSYLMEHCKTCHIGLYIPDSRYSPDNAVGAAYLSFLRGTRQKNSAYNT